MKHNLVVFGICITGLLLAGTLAARAEDSSHQTAFNPVTDWAWSYLGNSPSLPQQGLTVLLTYCNDGVCFASAPAVECFTNGSTPPSSINVCKNEGPGTAYYQTIVQPPDLLRMDPENGTAVVRFTVPANGAYFVSGRYEIIDTVGNEVTVSIVHHGEAGDTNLLPATPLSGYGNCVPFKAKVWLRAGTTIDFTVNTGGNYAYESTGLKADISPIHEH
jgi:hypothetical protein